MDFIRTHKPQLLISQVIFFFALQPHSNLKTFLLGLNFFIFPRCWKIQDLKIILSFYI